MSERNRKEAGTDGCSVTVALPNGRYPNAYGTWAGNPKGQPPDYTRCCEQVWSRERWSRHYQCNKPRGHGPDKAYCKQHDPEVAKARVAAADARSNAKWNKERYNIHGPTFYKALLKIAEGHNDARGLAQEIIDTFKKGEVQTQARSLGVPVRG